MRLKNVIPLEHKYGGGASPYERWHLNVDQYGAATRLATLDLDGLAPAAAPEFRFVDVPHRSSSAGSAGDRALDVNYFYIYVAAEGKWARVPLSTF